jgi:hypothetical protein
LEVRREVRKVVGMKGNARDDRKEDHWVAKKETEMVKKSDKKRVEEKGERMVAWKVVW